MRLVEAAKMFKKLIVVFFGTFFIFFLATEGWPSIKKDFFPETVPPAPILYKFNPISFSVAKQFGTGENGIDTSNAKIVYRRNALQDWNSLKSKQSKLYTYDFNVFKDIDYRSTARGIADFLGYEDANLISDAELNNDYVWTKNNITFTINKNDQEMKQVLPNGEIAPFKNFFSSGEFLSTDYARQKAKEMMTASKKFTTEEINKAVYEGEFYKFEGSNLVESPNLSAEVAFIKPYLTLDNKKIVGKVYEIPQSLFFIGSLRPEIASTYKNYRYPTFKISKNRTTEAFNGENFDLTPIPTAVNNVINNKYFVIAGLYFSNAPLGADLPTNLKIENISLETVEVGIYDDLEKGIIKNQILQPIYIFKGFFDTPNGQRGRIILYTPAIDPKYYN
jgi:hypothetical protein